MRYLTILLFIGGCSSLHSRVDKEIQVGDLTTHVRSVLGTPSAFGPGYMVYIRAADTCRISVRDEIIVSSVECVTDPNYKSAFQRAMKGFSDGLNANRSVSCTTNQLGTTAYTNCQ
jgi:hypothetical protein